MAKTNPLPLAGVRVLDFTWVVAGPVATRILADHGAEVVKIERKVPPQLGDRKRGLFCDLHRDKLSVAINMSHPEGLELARKLALKSDLVMDNFSATMCSPIRSTRAEILKIGEGCSTSARPRQAPSGLLPVSPIMASARRSRSTGTIHRGSPGYCATKTIR